VKFLNKFNGEGNIQQAVFNKKALQTIAGLDVPLTGHFSNHFPDDLTLLVALAV